jgi:hypothetical protein
MTLIEKIEKLLGSELFSTSQKLLMILYHWAMNQITSDQATALFTKCGYAFSVPTTTGATILTDGAASPTVYTISTLITGYKDSDYTSSLIVKMEITEMISLLFSSGYITSTEQTTLKGLTW